MRIIDHRRATLYVERARMMPDLDTTGHFIRSSMGMYVEALALIAANAGFTLRHQLLGGGTQPLIPFAELQLEPGAQLFGREDPPMIFQYNPLDYVIEQNPQKELVFTIARLANVSPKIRYNLHDSGGIYRHADLLSKMGACGLDPSVIGKRSTSFPVVYVYGRSDLSVAFFGCKIFTSDLEHIIFQQPTLSRQLNTFQIQIEEDEQFNRTLHLHLERSEGSDEPLDVANLQNLFFDGLKRVNQDFRETSKMITSQQVRVTIYPFATGLFAGRDIRIKNRYITSKP